MIVNRWFRKSKTFGKRLMRTQAEQLHEMRERLAEMMQDDAQQQHEATSTMKSVEWNCDANGSEVP